MAMNDEPSKNRGLEQATLAMRDAPQPGWIDLSSSIREAVRTSVRRGIELSADPGSGARNGSDVRVCDVVLKLRLRDEINGERRALSNVGFSLDGAALQRVVLDLVCQYGADFVAEADLARSSAATVLREVLGSRGNVSIDVNVIDVELSMST